MRPMLLRLVLQGWPVRLQGRPRRANMLLLVHNLLLLLLQRSVDGSHNTLWLLWLLRLGCGASESGHGGLRGSRLKRHQPHLLASHCQPLLRLCGLNLTRTDL